MPQLTNSPKQFTGFRLEASKSYSLGLFFKRTDLGGGRGIVDITGSTTTLVVRNPALYGGDVVLTSVFSILDAEGGYGRFNIQAEDLTLPAIEYDFAITHVTVDGYSTVVLKGTLEILENTDTDDSNTFTTSTSPTSLTLLFMLNSTVKVEVVAWAAGELGIGTVTTLAPGEDATAAVVGNYPNQLLNLGIPAGLVGDTGPAPELEIGTVDIADPGGPAEASFTGSDPYELNLVLPPAVGFDTTVIDAGGGKVAVMGPYITDNGDGTVTINYTGSEYVVKVPDNLYSLDAGTYGVDIDDDGNILGFAPIVPSGGHINVKDFGAIGDGVTDDTVAINLACAAINPLIGLTTVYFPPGTYMVQGVNPLKTNGASSGQEAGVQPQAGTTLLLDRNAIIRVIPNHAAGYSAIYIAPDFDDVTIRGGQIQGERDLHDWTTLPHATSEWGYGVYAHGAQNVLIDSVHISKMTGDCVIGSSVGSVDDLDPAYNPSSGRIVNCYLDGSRRNNISIIAADHWTIENNTISRAGYDDGNHDGTAPRAGIDLEFSSSQAVKATNIRNNRFVDNVTASVECFNSNQVVVEANYLNTSLIMGAHINNNAVIQANVFYNLAETVTSAVALSGGSTGENNILIEGNMVFGFGDGVFLTGNGVTCQGNYLKGFTNAGVSVYLYTDISVFDNHISDPAAGGATTASGIKFRSPGAAPKVEVFGNRISNCYYGLNWTQNSTGVTAKGNIITKGFTGFVVGSNCAAVLIDNVTDLPGHSSGTQGSDVTSNSTSKLIAIGNTFRNSTSASITATSGGAGGTSRLIRNKIINTLSTIGIDCNAGTHEVVGNVLSSAATSGTNYAIQIRGAATGCVVIGNTAYHNAGTPWSRLVKSDAATGTPATQIFGNTFYGATVATPHASDYVGGNTFLGVKRVATAASGATLDVNVDQTDVAKRTAQAVNLTINAPTGTPAPLQEILYRIKDSGSARTLTWNAIFTGELPSTTVSGVTHYVLARWNSDLGVYECKNLTPIQGTPTGAKFLRDDGTWATPAGGGTDPASPQPSDQSLLGWSFDPTASSGGTVITSGSIVCVRVPVRTAMNITNLILGIFTAGATLTAGQSFAALYQGNALLAVTADQSGSWNSTGIKTMALVGGPIAVTAGYVEVCFWSVGTTPPAFARGAHTSSGLLANANFGSTVGRFTQANAGLTTTAPATLSTPRSQTLSFWAGIS